jgi:hypothetical protein
MIEYYMSDYTLLSNPLFEIDSGVLSDYDLDEVFVPVDQSELVFTSPWVYGLNFISTGRDNLATLLKECDRIRPFLKSIELLFLSNISKFAPDLESIILRQRCYLFDRNNFQDEIHRSRLHSLQFRYRRPNKPLIEVESHAILRKREVEFLAHKEDERGDILGFLANKDLGCERRMLSRRLDLGLDQPVNTSIDLPSNVRADDFM